MKAYLQCIWQANGYVDLASDKVVILYFFANLKWVTASNKIVVSSSILNQIRLKGNKLFWEQ